MGVNSLRKRGKFYSERVKHPVSLLKLGVSTQASKVSGD